MYKTISMDHFKSQSQGHQMLAFEGPEVPWPPSAPDHAPQPGVYYVQKDIPQGRVVIGHLGYQRKDWNDPETYAIAVMNDILGGGGFTSRLGTKRPAASEAMPVVHCT